MGVGAGRLGQGQVSACLMQGDMHAAPQKETCGT